MDPDEPARREAQSQLRDDQWYPSCIEVRLPLGAIAQGSMDHTTIYDRFNRWSKAYIWSAMLRALATMEAADLQCIDSTSSKAHRCSAGGAVAHWSLAAAEVVVGAKSTRLQTASDRKMIALETTLGRRGDIRPVPQRDCRHQTKPDAPEYSGLGQRYFSAAKPDRTSLFAPEGLAARGYSIR